MLTLDPFAWFFKLIFLIAAALSIAISLKYLDIERENHGEYYALILFATMGMMFMAGAMDLVTLYIGLETMAIATYVLVGFLRSSQRSNEASLKYFLLGAFSSGILLYGFSLLYGMAGSTRFEAIRDVLRAAPVDRPAFADGAGHCCGRDVFQDRRRSLPSMDPGRLRRRANVDHGISCLSP